MNRSTHRPPPPASAFAEPDSLPHNVLHIHMRREIANSGRSVMAGILEGKVALVTGGGSGIGRATAVIMAREGARVAVSDLSKDGIEATVGLINAAGGQGIAIAGDVTDETDVSNMVARTVSAYGRLDCAFNNAGISSRAAGAPAQRLHELSREAVDKMLAVNLTGVFMCLKHEIIQMLKQGSGGAIVNTASIAGLIRLPTPGPH